MVISAALAGETERQVPSPTAATPAYPTSPYHGVIDGNGQVIPCRCRFGGKDHRLGVEVCLSTPSGNVLARCDLLQNNTSWVMTGVPCTLSRAPVTAPSRLAALLHEGPPATLGSSAADAYGTGPNTTKP